jgi:hypothetical protein
MTPVVRSKVQAWKQSLIGWVTDHFTKWVNRSPYITIHLHPFVVIGHGYHGSLAVCWLSHLFTPNVDICRLDLQAEPRPQPAGLSDTWHGGSIGNFFKLHVRPQGHCM